MQGEAEGEDVGFMNLGIDRVVTYIYIYTRYCGSLELDVDLLHVV